MKIIFRALLTILSTSWLIIIFYVKEKELGFATIIILFNIVLTLISLKLTRYLDLDNIKRCSACELADSDFLPAYLGYFFIAFSINDAYVMLLTFTLLSFLVYETRAEYFNPTFLMFGYHFYHITVENGVRIFLIAKGGIIKDIHNLHFDNLRRINDVTFITGEKVF